MFFCYGKGMKEKKVVIKLLAVMLVIALSCTNLILLENFLGRGVSYAASAEDNSTNVDNVKFEVYLDTNNRGEKTVRKDMNSDNLIIYTEVKVQGGRSSKRRKNIFWRY